MIASIILFPDDFGGAGDVSRFFKLLTPPLISERKLFFPGEGGALESSSLSTLRSLAPPAIESKKLSFGAPGGGPTFGGPSLLDEVESSFL